MPDWEVRGALGNRWLFVLRELLQLLPTWDNVRGDVRRFLEAAEQASQASVSMIAGVICLILASLPPSNVHHCSVAAKARGVQFALRHICRTCRHHQIILTTCIDLQG